MRGRLSLWISLSRCCDRSSQLIQNVKKLQNFRKGLIQTKEVDVCKVLSEIPREFGAVPDKSVSLNLNGCEHCHVVANELLHDVFANLVINAIKHTGARADIFIDLERVGRMANATAVCRSRTTARAFLMITKA